MKEIEKYYYNMYIIKNQFITYIRFIKNIDNGFKYDNRI